MSPTFHRSNFGIEVPFLVLATLTWLFGILLLQEDGSLFVGHLSAFAPFIAFAIASSFFLLRLFGYFDVIRLFPRRSDLLLVMLAIPLGGMASCFIYSALVEQPDPLLLNVTLLSPLITLLSFGIHHLVIALRLRANGTPRIVLDLAHSERALVLQDLASWGFLDKIEILSRRDLELELLGPNPRSISLVIISSTTAKSFEEDETILEAHLAGIPIEDYRRICARLSGRVRLSHSNVLEYVLAATPQTMLIRAYGEIKNIAEPIFATFLFFTLLPLFTIIAALIKVSSPGPIFFRQVRLGHRQKPFQLIKFRTMDQNSESAGPMWCQHNDVRITLIGKFLRKLRLDELPQLWNVICGEMSFVGPRPEQPELAKQLAEQIPSFALRTLVKPGISGWAQVCAGYAASVEESRLKLEYDLFYIQNMSPRLDLIVLLRTISTALKGERKPTKTILVEMPMVTAGANSTLFNGVGFLLRVVER